MSKTVRRYGWVCDLPDHRDFMYQGSLPPKATTLPPMVDLRDGCSPVEDQKQLGSCTANALVGNLEFLEKKARDIFYTDLSRLFIYYNERALEHTVASDSGATLRDGIKTLKAYGVCSEGTWPYQVTKFRAKPSVSCYREASKHKISSYHRIMSLNDMKFCLAEGYPFVLGITLYETFESAGVAKSGVVYMPRPGERALGGHAVMAVGYDDTNNRFLIRNSWGKDWGQDGYFTIPYNYLANENLCDDAWTIRK